MFQLPCKISAFELFAEVGRGKTHVVYHATDTHFGREIALEVLLVPIEVERQIRATRFIRECRMRASLSEEHETGIPRLLQVGEWQGHLYCVREFVDGNTFEHLVRNRLIDLRKGIEVLRTVADVVQRIHGYGIVHRNLLQENVLVSTAGEVKLIGFGRATILATDQNPPECPGTPATVDVQALQTMLSWLCFGLGHQIPKSIASMRHGSMESAGAFAKSLKECSKASNIDIAAVRERDE